MTLTEKVAYIKGLTDGLKLDESKDHVKVLNAIVEILDDMAQEITDMEECLDDVCEQVDAIDEDLSFLEEDFYEGALDDYDEDEEMCDCGCCGSDFDEDGEDVFYEVVCPTCGEEIRLQEDVLLLGETDCPECGENLEFDFSDLMEDDFKALDCDCKDDCDETCDCGCHDDDKTE